MRQQTPPDPAPGDIRPVPRRGVRGRALLFGALGAAATAVLVTQAEMVLSTLRIGYLQFPPAALGLLLLAVVLSRGLNRLSHRWGFSSSDLLVIYCMSLVAALVSSHGIVQKLVPALVTPNSMINNGHAEIAGFSATLPQRLVPYNVSDPGHQNVVDWYYARMPRGASMPWHLWLGPLLNWGILIGLMLFAFLCLTAILRRQWVDNEKLSFPLAQLPLEIAGDEDTQTFFRNRLLWIGVLIPMLVFGLKGLHQVQPSVPDVTLQVNLNDYLTLPPWNRLSFTPFILSFAALGFFYLLPVDVLFSIWFFFVLSRVEELTMIRYGVDLPAMPLYPPPLFIGYQTIGAYLVLAGYFVWIARAHLRNVWEAALGRTRADDADELLPYRVAFWGLVGSIALSALWLWGNGMSLWLALFELFGCLFVIGLVMARTTAEAGMLMTETTFRPIDLIRMVTPLHGLGMANLTMLAFFDNLFLRDQRGLLLTGMLDGARLTDGARVSRRAFVGVFAIGIGIALVVAVSLNVVLPYHLGANTMDSWMEQGSPQMTWNDYAQHLHSGVALPNGANWQMPTFFGVGIVMTLFLSWMRSTFFWWPLHPLGYALSGSWSTVEFWFPCFLAWLFKSLSIRYGGIGFYARARPFFLGLVLGEFGMATLFVLLNILFKIPPPPFPWG